MKPRYLHTFPFILLSLLVMMCCMPVMAATGDPVTVVYQESFSSDPKWITNNPSSDYWDSSRQMYHFSIEPSTGAYAYTPVSKYDKGSFTFEYDVILNQVDEGTTFRLGFSSTDMDPEKGPNVLTEFTNAKYGQIMWLHLVTPGNKLMKVNSESGDTQSSGDIAYKGPTVNYELNKTYHVALNYNNDQHMLTMKVNEKTSGDEVWGYYLNTVEDLRGMNRIYLGSIGDYGMMNRYAKGYIDNVRITVPRMETSISTVPSTVVTTAPLTAPTVTKKSTAVPKITLETPLPETTPESPVSPLLPLLAVCIGGLCCMLLRQKPL